MSKFDVKVERINAGDIRAYFDSRVLRVWHLDGKERVFRIVDIDRVESEFKGSRQKQPQVYLETLAGKRLPLPLALNKTNMKTIAQLYGYAVKGWMGQCIALYPTTTDVGGQTVDCIRVRPQKPKPAKGADVEPLREPGDDADEEPSHGMMDPDAEPPPEVELSSG